MTVVLLAAWGMLVSCGPSEEEAVKVREGSNLDDVTECPALVCIREREFCAELIFEYGRSPPLCVEIDICDRLECREAGRRCALFDGVPAQVKCID